MSFGIVEPSKKRDPSATVNMIDTIYSPVPIFRRVTSTSTDITSTAATIYNALKDTDHILLGVNVTLPTATQLAGIYQNIKAGSVIVLWFTNYTGADRVITSGDAGAAITLARSNLTAWVNTTTQTFPSAKVAIRFITTTSYEMYPLRVPIA